MEMMSVACITRHELCIIYAFFILFSPSLEKSVANQAAIYMHFCYDNDLLNIEDGGSYMHNLVLLWIIRHILCICFIIFWLKSIFDQRSLSNLDYFLTYNFFPRIFFNQRFFFPNIFFDQNGHIHQYKKLAPIYHFIFKQI